LHGGSLMVESQPNRGTAITLTFPADRVVRAEGQKAA
jgi:signal transduction histidine kinase